MYNPATGEVSPRPLKEMFRDIPPKVAHYRIFVADRRARQGSHRRLRQGDGRLRRRGPPNQHLIQMPSPRYYLGFVTVGALLAAPLKSRPNNHAARRRSLRLEGFDYSKEGAYFVTICTRNRECLFGDVVNGKMCLNEAGRVVHTVWDGLSDRFPTIELVSFVVMPNHVHGILVVGAALALPVGGAASSAPTRSASTTLGTVVRAFKSISAIGVNRLLSRSGQSLWQRSYYEHVIRGEESLNRIREYISTNPLRWQLDRENSERTGDDEFDRWLATFKSRPDKRENP
jgi:REP element-mobilizing transposase RayT